MELESLSLVECCIIVLWIMMPAYIANTIAVLTGGKYPIDQGKTLADGNRMLGDGKTWSGLVGGTLGGVMVGYTQLNFGDSFIHSLVNSTPEDLWGDRPFLVFFLLSFGALFGDMSASFFKRRSSLKRGCLLYTSPSPRDGLLSRMPSSA